MPLMSLLPRTRMPTSGWLLVGQAVAVVQERRDVGHDRARSFLVDACSSGRVRSRIINGSDIAPPAWRGKTADQIDLDCGMIAGPDSERFLHIVFSEIDLNQLLARRPRGP